MIRAAKKLILAEPRPSYISRPAIVLDCSVLGALVFGEDTRTEAVSRLAGRALHAPWLLDHEIASVALKKRRSGWAQEAVDNGLQAYADQAIEMHRVPTASAVAVAQAYGLSTYDAAYLCVASMLRVPLVTFDAKLGKAAERHLGSIE